MLSVVWPFKGISVYEASLICSDALVENSSCGKLLLLRKCKLSVFRIFNNTFPHPKTEVISFAVLHNSQMILTLPKENFKFSLQLFLDF